MSRKFFSAGIEEPEELFNATSSDLKTLEALEEELSAIAVW
jgi:hypothetical protein